jgi:hypothetical protein
MYLISIFPHSPLPPKMEIAPDVFRLLADHLTDFYYNFSSSFGEAICDHQHQLRARSVIRVLLKISAVSRVAQEAILPSWKKVFVANFDNPCCNALAAADVSMSYSCQASWYRLWLLRFDMRRDTLLSVSVIRTLDSPAYTRAKELAENHRLLADGKYLVRYVLRHKKTMELSALNPGYFSDLEATEQSDYELLNLYLNSSTRGILRQSQHMYSLNVWHKRDLLNKARLREVKLELDSLHIRKRKRPEEDEGTGAQKRPRKESLTQTLSLSK